MGMMNRCLLVITLLFCSPGFGGDDVDESLEIVGLNDQGEVLVLEKWSLLSDSTIAAFPKFFSTHRTVRNELTQFADIALLAGAPSYELREKYAPLVEAKWAEMLAVFRKAGYKADGYQELKTAVDAKEYTTIHLPDGRTLTEVPTILRRKPNDLQRENISFWITENGKRRLLDKDAVNTVVRTFSHRKILKAYWLPRTRSLVALYNPMHQSADGRSSDLWIYQFEK